MDDRTSSLSLIFFLFCLSFLLAWNGVAENTADSLEAEQVTTSNVVKDREGQLKEDCSGSIYRSKKKDIAVYKDFDLSSRVVYRLRLGEKVCYVGEREGFAILDWRLFSDSDLEEESLELAYARIADLWPPRSQASKKSSSPPGLVGAVFGKAKEYFRRLRYGQPPSDALEPIRPALDAIEEKVN